MLSIARERGVTQVLTPFLERTSIRNIFNISFVLDAFQEGTPMITTAQQTNPGVWRRVLLSSVLAFAVAMGCMGLAVAQDQPDMKSSAGLTSLITETPEEGFALAVKLSQKAVATTQTDAEVRK